MITLFALVFLGQLAHGVALWWLITRVEDNARTLQGLHGKHDQLHLAVKEPRAVIHHPSRGPAR